MKLYNKIHLQLIFRLTLTRIIKLAHLEDIHFVFFVSFFVLFFYNPFLL